MKTLKVLGDAGRVGDRVSEGQIYCSGIVAVSGLHGVRLHEIQ